MKYPITILATCLVGCLPLEPDVTGIFVTYNFCLHPIEVKNTELSDNYENKKISSTNKEKLGAEIPFTRYFYKYVAPESSDKLLFEFMELEKELASDINVLLKSEV